MKILILGSGYIGSEIAYEFSKDNQITCIDHGDNFSKISSKLKNVKLIKGDILDHELVKNISNEMDLICYCIGTGGVVNCIENPDHYKKINIDDFKKLLDSIENKNCRFLLLSTTFVYSNSEKNFENMQTNPDTIYGKLRLQQESILMNSELSYTILRMSNIYGHKNFWIRKFDNVIDKFISTGFSNKKILLYADGTQLVDFIHISNFLNILNQIINQKFQKEIYNITSETRQSIHDIALLIKNIAGKKYNISIQINKNDSSKKLPNIPDASASKIKNKIIWQDYQDLSFELEKMCAKIMND